jgi:predicted nucleic acid-binding protein
MKLMLDTNVCIYLIKEHPASVLERFASHPVGIGMSVITLAELEYGVSKSSRSRQESRSVGTVCLTARDRLIRPPRDCGVREAENHA